MRAKWITHSKSYTGVFLAILIFIWTTPWEDWSSFYYYKKIFSSPAEYLICDLHSEPLAILSSDPRVCCRCIDYYYATGCYGNVDRFLKILQERYDSYNEREQIDILMTMERYRAFDRDYEGWLLNKLSFFLPNDVYLRARIYLLDYEKESLMPLTYSEKKQIMLMLENMLTLEENQIENTSWTKLEYSKENISN